MTEVPSQCPLCHELSIHACETIQSEGKPYTLYECDSCSGAWWEPFHNPGASWYEHDERYADRNQDPILKPNEKHKAVVAHFSGTPGTVLDVGCGVGNFLAFAKKYGWEGWGIDFDRDAIEAGKKTFGLKNLEVADLSQFVEAHPSLTFDLITYFDVFEHLDNHNEFIEEVKRLLAPGGSVALSVPYRHGWRWLMPNDIPPRHLTRWDERSLKEFYRRHGFSASSHVRFPATFSFLIIKLRFRYGRWASVGLVRKIQAQAPRASSHDVLRGGDRRVELVRILARVKDVVLFGIPAALIWVVLLLTRARYTDFLFIAKLPEHADDNTH